MNKWMSVLSLTLVSLGIAATAIASSIQYDYDREVEFSRWTSFAWATPARPNVTLAEKRIRRAVEDGFEAKGYTLLDGPAQADFVIACQGAAWRDAQVHESYHGPGFGRSLRVDRVPTGVLIIEVFDRRTGKLAWRGTVSDELANDPAQADKRTAKAVAKLLRKFPGEGR